jgi:hypothetical protein
LYAPLSSKLSSSLAVFSANPTDRDFFLGERSGCDESSVINTCGSLKPCVHGSDAHCEDKLFNPDENRFCWIKADLTYIAINLYRFDNMIAAFFFWLSSLDFHPVFRLTKNEGISKFYDSQRQLIA